MDGLSSTQAGDSQVLESKIMMATVLRQETATVRGNPVALLSSEVSSTIESPESSQSNPYAPVIVDKQLNDYHGDTVKVDAAHPLIGEAIMGDRKARDSEEGIDRSQMSVMIDQTRKPVEAGSRMTAQRRGYNVPKLAERLLNDWYKRYMTERFFSHLAGARSTWQSKGSILANVEPTFRDGRALDNTSAQYTNDITPPTALRRFFAGAADSISHTANPIQQTDTLDFDSLRRMCVTIAEGDYPLQAALLSNEDNKIGMDPMYFGFLTPTQFDDAIQSDPNYDANRARAITATKGYDHPIFRNECFMIENVLFFKYYHPRRWTTGDTILYREDTRLGNVQEDVVPANVLQVDRGFIIGAQALFQCYAGDTTGAVFQTNYGMDDYDDKEGICLRFMEGMRKTVQHDIDGYAYDVGVATIDSAAVPRA